MNNVNIMLDKKVWAVIGATKNPSKFGYKIYKKLLSRGYKVYPINPVYDEIDGEKCYNSISEIDEKIDCVNVVISPERAINYIKDISSKGIKYVWFQPGSFNNEVINKALEEGLELVYHNCVLVELG